MVSRTHCVSIVMRGAMTALMAAVLASAGALWPGCGASRPAGFSPATPALVHARALELLPRDTLFVLAAHDPQTLLDQMGYGHIAARHPELMKRAMSAAVDVVGANILEPGNLPEIGLDPHGSWGLAWLDARHERVAFFAPLVHEERFATLLYRLAAHAEMDISKAVQGQGTVFWARGHSEVAVLIRDRMAFLVISDHGAEDALEAARFMATLQPSGSLAHEARYQAAMERLRFGHEAAGYLDVGALVRMAGAAADNADDDDRSREYVEQLRQEVAELEAQGQAEGDIAERKAMLREQVEWLERRDKERKMRARLVERLFGKSAVLAFGMDVDRRAVRSKLVLDLPEDSLLRATLRPARETPVLLEALTSPPMFLIDGTVDPTAVQELVRGLAGSDAEDLDEAKSDLARLLGIDIDRDVLPLVAGEAGFAVTGELDTSASEEEDLFRSVDVHGVIRVADPARARALLAQIAARLHLAQKDEGGQAFLVIPIPGFKPVRVAVVGSYLAASTEPDFLARLAGKGRRPFLQSSEHRGLGELFMARRASFMTMYGASLFTTLFMGRAGGLYRYGLPTPMEPDGEAGDVPYSEAYRAKEREFARKQDRLRDLEEKRARQEASAWSGLARRFGNTAMTLEVAQHGLTGHAGQFVGDESIGSFVGFFIDLIERSDERSRAYWDSYDELQKLRYELESIRRSDIENYRQEHGNPAAP